MINSSNCFGLISLYGIHGNHFETFKWQLLWGCFAEWNENLLEAAERSKKLRNKRPFYENQLRLLEGKSLNVNFCQTAVWTDTFGLELSQAAYNKLTKLLQEVDTKNEKTKSATKTITVSFTNNDTIKILQDIQKELKALNEIGQMWRFNLYGPSGSKNYLRFPVVTGSNGGRISQ